MRTPFLRPAFLLSRPQTQNTNWRNCTVRMMTSVTTPPAPELHKVTRVPDVSRIYVLGTIPIQSGMVLITDPGYEEKVGEFLEYPDGSLCNRILECVPGNYEVRYTKDLDEYKNPRTGLDRCREMVSLGIFHPAFKTVEPNELLPPYLAVDTAYMSFSDANHKVPLVEGMLQGTFYKDQVAVVDWHGTPVACCETGADGAYPLLVARDPEGRIVAAEVLFHFFDDGEVDDGEDDDE